MIPALCRRSTIGANTLVNLLGADVSLKGRTWNYQ